MYYQHKIRVFPTVEMKEHLDNKSESTGWARGGKTSFFRKKVEKAPVHSK